MTHFIHPCRASVRDRLRSASGPASGRCRPRARRRRHRRADPEHLRPRVYRGPGGARRSRTHRQVAGAQLSNGVVVEDDVCIGPNATFANDHFPCSRQYRAAVQTTLREGCSIGAGATILPGLVIGREAMVGADRWSPPRCRRGRSSPATRRAPSATRTASPPPRKPSTAAAGAPQSVTATAVPGVTLHRLRLVEDARGKLAVGEFAADVPFVPKQFLQHFRRPRLPCAPGERALRDVRAVPGLRAGYSARSSSMTATRDRRCCWTAPTSACGCRR